MYSFIRCYFLSSYKKIYRSIANEYKTSAIHVYRLAHGKRSRGNRDYVIKKRLKEEGVIKAVFN
ncbi:hypothetical protein JS578_02910 [Dysgonomonadaceae bacterium zrk40]|nr:hypothetical protein JS578_02910 [Dysgonomonadaceae bacterium zrk40]